MHAVQTAAHQQHAQEEKARKAADHTQKALERKTKQEAKLADLQAKTAAKLAKTVIPKPKAAAQVHKAQNVVTNNHVVSRAIKVVAGRMTHGRAIIVP